MRKIVPINAFKPFTPEEIATIEAAFREAVNVATADSLRLPHDEARELIAMRVIEMAQRGERDKDRLRADALAHLARERYTS